MMNDEMAVAQLQALVQVPGALKIITNEIVPKLRAGAESAASLRSDLSPQLLKRCDTFVWHDVVRVIGPDRRGNYRALSAEGDWCEGAPASLLRRLLEWSGGVPVAAPEIKQTKPKGWMDKLKERMG